MIPFDKLGDEIVGLLAGSLDLSGIEGTSCGEDEDTKIPEDAEEKLASRLIDRDEALQSCQPGQNFGLTCIRNGSYCAYECEQEQEYAAIALPCQLPTFTCPNQYECNSTNPFSCNQDSRFACSGIFTCTTAYTEYDKQCNKVAHSCGTSGSKFVCGTIDPGFSCQTEGRYVCTDTDWFSCFGNFTCRSLQGFQCNTLVRHFCSNSFVCQPSVECGIGISDHFVCDKIAGAFTFTCIPGQNWICPELRFHCDPDGAFSED